MEGFRGMGTPVAHPTTHTWGEEGERGAGSQRRAPERTVFNRWLQEEEAGQEIKKKWQGGRRGAGEWSPGGAEGRREGVRRKWSPRSDGAGALRSEVCRGLDEGTTWLPRAERVRSEAARSGARRDGGKQTVPRRTGNFFGKFV